MTDGYAALLRTALRHRWATLAIIVGLFVASIVVLMPHIKTEFFPQQDNSRIGITVKLPAGTRQETTRALGFRIYEQLKSNCPEVTTVSFSEGQAGEDNIFGSMQDNGNNILQYNISTVRSTERERSLSEICDAIRHDLNQYPEIRTFNVAAGVVAAESAVRRRWRLKSMATTSLRPTALPPTCRQRCSARTAARR